MKNNHFVYSSILDVSFLFSPLLPNGNYSYRSYNQNFVFKKRRDQEKISYKRHVYESVDDESLS